MKVKKSAALLLMLFFCFCTSYSQKVDSIKTEQSGDYIKIRYKILDSKPGELYNIKVLCSINGGLNTELRSVSGDVGDMVAGGKPEYWVVWDVLKDVEEVTSVDFIVRAELKKGLITYREQRHIINLAAAFQFSGPGVGIRLGIMEKFGVSAQFITWKAMLDNDPAYTDGTQFVRFSLALASRLVKAEKTQVHLLTGLTVGNSLIKEIYADNGNPSSSHFKKAMTPGPELGVAFSTGRVILTVMGTKLLTNLTEQGQSISKNTFVSASIGMKF